MSAIGLALAVVLGGLVGFLIGCVGIGGVLLVPVLTYLGDVEIHLAISAAMVSYIFSGGMGAIVFARRGSLRRAPALWLCLGATPAAFLGAATVWSSPGALLEFVVAAVTLVSAWQSFRRPAAEHGEDGALPGPFALLAIGAVTGYGSALTGTGGPVILLSILMWTAAPILASVGLSLIIQVPIGMLATAGNLAFGAVDPWIAGAISAGSVGGALLGARLAHAAPRALMRRAVAAMLAGTGMMILGRLAYGLVAAPG
jgi:uncharacterized membrane protein YfcA